MLVNPLFRNGEKWKNDPESVSRTRSPPKVLLIGRSNHKGKGKGLDTCYSATYMSQTRDQQRFTISEVAADWH